MIDIARKRILTFSSDKRWRKQIDGRVYYFGRGRSKMDSKAYRNAERLYLKFMEGRERRLPIEILVHELTLGDAVEKYLQHLEDRYERPVEDCENRRDISASYVSRAISQASLFVTAIGSEMPLMNVTELTLEDYRSTVLRLPLSERTGRPISRATAKNRLDTVKAFYKWAYKMRLIENIPRNLEDYTKVSLGTPKVKTFTISEIHRLWNAAPSRTKAFIALGLNTGYGQKDIADLLVGEVNFVEGIIERERSKTGIPSRHMLWPVTAALLREHLRNDAASDERFFLGKDGKPLHHEELENGRVRKTDAIRNAFWRVQQRTGINGGRGFYTLRKTAASEIERIDPLVTSMFLAHSLREMKRHYAVRNWAALDTALQECGRRINLDDKGAFR